MVSMFYLTKRNSHVFNMLGAEGCARVRSMNPASHSKIGRVGKIQVGTIILRSLLLSVVAASAAIAQQPLMREGVVTVRDGVKLQYRIYGERGDTIVHLHGGPGGDLRGQLPNLTELARKHVLIGYDQRGGGRSVPVDTMTITVETHVKDLEDVRAALSIPRMTLYGHSWGATLAALYAAEYPQYVHQLILNGPMPPAKSPYDAQRWEAIAAAKRRMCKQQGTDSIDACAQRIRNAVVYYYDTLNIARNRGGRVAIGGDGINEHGHIANRRTIQSLGNWDFRLLLQRLMVRTLVVEGAESPVPLDQVRLWAQSLPDARTLVVPNTGHGYPHIENPEYFFPALEEFLAGHWPAAAER